MTIRIRSAFIYEMRTLVLLIFLMKRGLTAMWNRPVFLRAEHGLTTPFLRLATARRLKLNTTFVMDNRRT